MAGELSKEEEEEIKEAFNLFDRDGDGKITTDELGTVMRSLGACPTQAQVKQIIAEIDPQGTGLVDYSGIDEIPAHILLVSRFAGIACGKLTSTLAFCFASF
uniref:EF-hand domain-containing protein n=1 Tax=Rhodosorus marinus TaxID=101924 RepID=A0A7S3E640_9RHOD|mmetsp:Transcript_11909/g.49706  ORF Transcript_11909/g.49706 Transcript_11909/m.49706 type:complete len:102 (+) Transcript_11909:131-436(+)